MQTQFKTDVDKGLNSEPKFLSSRYFYDEKGDKLFEQIMRMPEYYLTDAEHEIFKNQTGEIVNGLQLRKDVFFELIELGAGDGTKTKELLRHLIKEGYDFAYLPVDISQHALDNLCRSLHKELPDLVCTPQQGDYFDVLESLKESHHPKAVLFLGSNMGNLKDEEAHEFLYGLGANLNKNDKLFLGVDLIKPKEVVLPAYDDPHKITSQFNLNLLERMNRELEAEFDLEHFEHAPEYEENEGVARSFLVSKKHQSVTIGALNKTIDFSKGEKIHTEISRKYNDEILGKILAATDFTVTEKLTDSKKYFADYILNRG